MNRELNSIKWNEILGTLEPDLVWLKFKNILFHIINEHNPKITVKDNHYTPWHDKETFNLTKKKARLRKNILRQQNCSKL